MFIALPAACAHLLAYEPHEHDLHCSTKALSGDPTSYASVQLVGKTQHIHTYTRSCACGAFVAPLWLERVVPVINDTNWIVGRAQGNMDGYDSSEEAEYVVNWRLLLLILSSALLTRVLHGFSDSLCQWVRLQSTSCLLEPFCPDEHLCDGRLGFSKTSRLHGMELCVCSSLSFTRWW